MNADQIFPLEMAFVMKNQTMPIVALMAAIVAVIRRNLLANIALAKSLEDHSKEELLSYVNLFAKTFN